MVAKHPKFLIIRFSSIGDIIQCMTIVGGIKQAYPDAEIHWVARQDMSGFLQIDQRIHRIWAFDKKTGLKGLLAMSQELQAEKFDYIYDAHSNIRSWILKAKLSPFWKRWAEGKPKLVVRSKERLKRILLFQFRKNLFPKPFRGFISFQKPLVKWGITSFSRYWEQDWQFSEDLKSQVASLLPQSMENTVTIVPSAAWEMKRWPVSHWKKLVELLPDKQIIILGGPADTFCAEIAAVAPSRVVNLAGKTSLLESCYVVKKSQQVVSADTGFLHAADLFHVPAFALLGPTAFGFPTGQHVKVLEKPMPCRPCTKDGRGKCSQKTYQACLVNITPEEVAAVLG